MTQLLIDKETPGVETFTRLKKTDVKDSSLPDAIIEHYTGPKKTKMPPEEAAPGIYSAQFLEDQAAIKKLSQELDLQFFQAKATTSDTPEYSGFNTKDQREKGVSCGKKMKSMYTPLTDLKPSDPSTDCHG